MIERIWIYLLFPGVPLLVLYCLHRRALAKRAHLARPFKDFRRPAGYSLQEKVDEKSEELSLSILGFVFTAMFPGIAYSMGAALPVGIIAGFIPCAYFTRRLLKAWAPYQDNKLGLIGEQITGAELDALQTNDVRAYHDLVFVKDGRTWNVDHVLLTVRGILVIETKARRKRRVGREFPDKLVYDGRQITYPNGHYETQALQQVKSNVTSLLSEIHTWTGGMSVPVFPVLVYPGWKIERTANGDVYVVGHDKLGQLLPLRGEMIYPPTFKILKSNLDRRSRVAMEEGTSQIIQTDHHYQPALRSPEAAAAEGSALMGSVASGIER